MQRWPLAHSSLRLVCCDGAHAQPWQRTHACLQAPSTTYSAPRQRCVRRTRQGRGGGALPQLAPLRRTTAASHSRYNNNATKSAAVVWHAATAATRPNRRRNTYLGSATAWRGYGVGGRAVIAPASAARSIGAREHGGQAAGPAASTASLASPCVVPRGVMTGMTARRLNTVNTTAKMARIWWRAETLGEPHAATRPDVKWCVYPARRMCLCRRHVIDVCHSQVERRTTVDHRKPLDLMRA